ncbi:hypothetical protein BaOVIS_028300 [Babesia ovis]|uniref:PUB domain-containing protein n=1 Tax=Babesia ovis TaxID=5869 RepID=A0A9W5TCZ1_BABOV|nr:hypothetical protein BaOVIS_028300 [Babesia ovis]
MECSAYPEPGDVDAPNPFEIDRVDFVGSSDSTALTKALNELRTTTRDELKCKGYKRLLKIVENILLNPWDHEKRRIRKTNAIYAQQIASNPRLMAVLYAIGFGSTNGFVVLQIVDVPLLREAYRWLIAALRDEFDIHIKSLEGHFFDPFKAYKHSSDIGKNADTDSFECQGKDFTKAQIEKLERKLSETVKTTLRDWHPQIHFENKQKIGKVTNDATVDETTEQKHSTAHLINIYNVGKSGNFESLSQKHLERLKQQCEYVESKASVQLKIRLPANTVLTIHPPMKTTVATIKREIQSILIDTVTIEDWELVEMPMRRTLDENKTLIQQDISHRVVLQFRYKERRKTDEQIVIPEALRTLCSPETPAC